LQPSSGRKTKNDVQKQIEFLLENQAKHDAQIGKLIELQTKNELLMADLMSAVMSPERRISGLEGRS
jgi:hypothetical protein